MDATLIVLIVVAFGIVVLAKIFPKAISWVFDRFPSHFKPQQWPTSDDVIHRAVDVFGDVAKARAWLDRPNRALSGATPRSLLDTPEGRERVLTVLGRLTHGVYS